MRVIVACDTKDNIGSEQRIDSLYFSNSLLDKVTTKKVAHFFVTNKKVLRQSTGTLQSRRHKEKKVNPGSQQTRDHSKCDLKVEPSRGPVQITLKP